MRIFFTLLFSVIPLFYAFSQETQTFNRFSAGLSGGPTLMHGDVGRFGGYAGTVGLSYGITRTFAFQGVFSYGTLKGDQGDDIYSRFFTNDFMFYGGRFNINLYNILGFNTLPIKMNPYVFIGAGRMHSEISSVTSSNDPQLSGTMYSGQDWIHQTGAGLKFYLSPHFDLNLEWEYTLAKTDLIDGHNPAIFSNKSEDKFSTLKIGFTYTFGNSANKKIEWAEEENLLDDKLDEVLNQIEADQQAIKDRVEEEAARIDRLETTFTDEDNDGVVDLVDVDVQTPPGKRVTTKGVEIDTDYDGIPDSEDPCPTFPGTDGNPCPEGNLYADGGGTFGGGGNTDNSDNANDGGNANVNVTAVDLEKNPEYREEDIYNVDGSEGQYKYYIIGASFAVRANAEKYQDALRTNKNLNTLLVQNETKRYNRVVMAATNNPGEAVQLLNRYRQDHDRNTWLVINSAR